MYNKVCKSVLWHCMARTPIQKIFMNKRRRPSCDVSLKVFFCFRYIIFYLWCFSQGVAWLLLTFGVSPAVNPPSLAWGGSFYNQRLFNAQSLSLVDYLYTRDYPKIIVQPAHSCPASARQAGVYMFRSTFSFSFKKEKVSYDLNFFLKNSAIFMSFQESFTLSSAMSCVCCTGS